MARARIIEMLIESGIDTNYYNDESPVLLALRQNDRDALLVLYKHGVDFGKIASEEAYNEEEVSKLQQIVALFELSKKKLNDPLVDVLPMNVIRKTQQYLGGGTRRRRRRTLKRTHNRRGTQRRRR